MNNPQLHLFTDHVLLFRVGHQLLGRLLDRFLELFPGEYRFPSTAAENGSLFNAIAEQFSSRDGLPDPLLRSLEDIESLAAPENITNLHIPENVDYRDRESIPLYHAINQWLAAHPASPSPDSSPAGPIPSSSSNGPTVPVIAAPAEAAAPSPQAEPAPALPPLSSAPLTLRLSVLFHEIDPVIRHEFFERFEHDLRQEFPHLPEMSAADDAFDDAVYALLKQPAFLPDRMRQALLAIQELADPENRSLLRDLAVSVGVHGEKTATAEHYAVAFWLCRPFSPGSLQQLRDSLPHRHLDPDRQPKQPLPFPDEYTPLFPPPPESPAAPAANPASPPGDLAALARYPRHIISKLQPDVRESINQLLRRRVSYQQIVAQLGPRAPGINKSNLSRWKKTGHTLWLAEQQRREDAQAQIRLLFDLVRQNDNARLHEATQQIAAPPHQPGPRRLRPRHPQPDLPHPTPGLCPPDPNPPHPQPRRQRL